MKRMAERIISAVLASVLIFCVFSITPFASESDNHASWKLDCSVTNPSPGDVIDVDVYLQADYVTNVFGAAIVYDRDYYEPAQDNEADNIVIADDLAGLGSKNVVMSDKRSDSIPAFLYDSSYNDDMKESYAIVWFSFLFRASAFEDPSTDLIPSFETVRKVATLKLRYKSDAPDDGKGLIWMDPAYLQTAKDNSKHTFVARGSSNVVGRCLLEQKFGQTIDLSEAVLYFGVPELCAAAGSDAVVDGQRGLIYSSCSMGCANDVLDLVEAGDEATVEIAPSKNGYGTGTAVSVLICNKVFAVYTLVIYGDVTGDGYVDSFDVSLSGEYVNTFTCPDSDAFFGASDVYPDGYLDATDIAYIMLYANFE